MARNVRTARGDLVDFDAIIIKQQLAQAPMNIEVQKRKQFIDSKEGKPRGGAKEVPAAPLEVKKAELIKEEPVKQAAPVQAAKPVEVKPAPPVATEKPKEPAPVKEEEPKKAP